MYQLKQSLMLGSLANEEKNNLTIVPQKQSRCQNSNQVVATPLITGVEDCEVIGQIMFMYKPVISS